MSHTKIPLIVAHRGASFDAPENTLAAFKLAWEQSADAIEGDFHLTRDGQIVCMHDADAKRTAGVDRKLSDMTLDEVRRLEAGAWKSPTFKSEPVPTLAEILAIVPEGKRVLIEIKVGSEIVPELVRVIEASRVPLEQLRVISFSAETIAAVKRRMPALKVYWLTSYKKDESSGAITPTLADVLATLRRIGADGLDTHMNREVVDEHFVAAMRDAGMELHGWTVDDPAVAALMASLGFDSITTNRPAFIRGQLGR